MVNYTSSANDVQKNKEKCRELLNLSPNIRYVGLINEFGRTLAGQLRTGIVPLFNVEEARNEFFIEATMTRLRKNFESSIGRLKFTLSTNEKVITLIVPTATSNLLYFTFDRAARIEEITKTIESVKSTFGEN